MYDISAVGVTWLRLDLDRIRFNYFKSAYLAYRVHLNKAPPGKGICHYFPCENNVYISETPYFKDIFM